MEQWLETGALEESEFRFRGVLSSSARIGRRLFSKLKALATAALLDSPLFFLWLLAMAAAAAAKALAAVKRTTDWPPAGKVHVWQASDPPGCLADLYSPIRCQEKIRFPVRPAPPCYLGASVNRIRFPICVPRSSWTWSSMAASSLRVW